MSQFGTSVTSLSRNQASSNSADIKTLSNVFVIIAKIKVTLGLNAGLCKSDNLKRVSNLLV